MHRLDIILGLLLARASDEAREINYGEMQACSPRDVIPWHIASKRWTLSLCSRDTNTHEGCGLGDDHGQLFKIVQLAQKVL